jgi:hypothetical protein
MLNNQRDPSLRCNRFVISRHTLETIYELGWCAAGNTLTEIIILVRCSQTWINHFGGQTKIASLSLSPPVSIFIYIYIIERIKIGLDYWTGLDWITYIYIEIIHKIGLALDIHTHTWGVGSTWFITRGATRWVSTVSAAAPGVAFCSCTQRCQQRS